MFLFTEYEQTVMRGLDLMFDYSLGEFADKGILMLNLALTTEDSKIHVKEWMGFTKNLINTLKKHNPDLLYVIIGKDADKCKKMLPKRISTGSSVLYTGMFNKIEEHTTIKFKL